MIFRFDDVCGNSDIQKLTKMAEFIYKKVGPIDTWFCISPLYHKVENGRVFPARFKALSDHREFYKVDYCKIPKPIENITFVSHGLLHIDHRLLNKETQELSIITAKHLIRSKIFVPPFNKWNDITEKICFDNFIQLVRFEDGWLSAEHNEFNKDHDLWYLHGWRWDMKRLEEWLCS